MTDTELRGPALLAEAIKQIQECPETWDQNSWCGTVCCVGGKCLQLAGTIVSSDLPLTFVVAELLCISYMNAFWLCFHERTFKEICHFSETLTLGLNEEGFDRDGYDQEGEDKEGDSRFWNYHPVGE